MTTDEYQEKTTLLQRLRKQWKYLVLNQGKRYQIELVKEQVTKLDKEIKDNPKEVCGM